MHPRDFAALEAAIRPLDTPERRAQYRRGEFPRAERCKDLSKRYRWDLLWKSEHFLNLPSDLDDSHIDTALRKIVAPF